MREIRQCFPEELITECLFRIGDDPGREGLKETPSRVVRSWNELYAGYHKDPADIFKTFDDDQIGGLVYLKNIEFFSTCEHHMLPFSGVAHIGYIPTGPVIGVTKLARLLDIYARRLQIQERLAEQVTDALMKYLKPAGAACIIEAKHLCLSGDTLIELAFNDRSIHPNGIPIKDLVGKPGLHVYCYDRDEKQITIDKVKHVWEVGEKDVYKITYEWDVFNQHKKIRKSGSIKVTKDHQLMLRSRPGNRYNSTVQTREDGSFLSIDGGLSVGDGLMPFNCYEGTPGYMTLSLNNGSMVEEHRYLVGHKIGRKLRKGEVAHHADENSQNNSFDNLIKIDKADHDRLHQKGKPKTRKFEKPAWNRKTRNLLTCKNCGDEFTTEFAYQEKDRQFCNRDCYLEYRYSNHRITSIEFIGKEKVYDLETEKHHNFAANEIIVHNCMACRGVQKQHSVMGYSSMKGCFLAEAATRQEFIQLVT